LAASRWQAFENKNRETQATTADDGYLVKIVLSTTDLSLRVNGRCVHDGVATAGMVHVTEPRASARCVFRGPYDTLHLHVSNALISECVHDMQIGSGPVMATSPVLTRDSTTERLGRMLLATTHQNGSLYSDCVAIAIVARLFSGERDGGAEGSISRGGMVKWRLKRTIDYVEAHLGEPVRLADMAGAAGLTRMYFAAQFKASTGLRPHEYLLRRRIERAQEMLLIAGRPTVDVALSLGFQSQAHFTTTFARFVGQTPNAWRLAQGVTSRRP
jgi:AraC-like DNA-binding protein